MQCSKPHGSTNFSNAAEYGATHLAKPIYLMRSKVEMLNASYSYQQILA